MRISTLVLILTMLVSSDRSAVAEPLSREDNLFVAMTLASLVVPMKCKDYEIIDGGLLRLGDASGVVNAPRLMRAVVAALSAANNFEYDRDDLIPEVTRALNTVGAQIPKNGKYKLFCKNWGEMLVTNHVAQRK